MINDSALNSRGNRKNRIRYSYSGTVRQVLICVYITFCVLFSFVPLFITVINSMKTQTEIQMNVFAMPSLGTMFSNIATNYSKAWAAIGYTFLPTILTACVGAFFIVLLGSIAAYIFVFKNFYFKNHIFFFFIAVLLVPSIIGFPVLVPLIKNTFNLGDTYFGYLLPSIGGAWVMSMFLFRTFFGQQPMSIYESARLDGANDFQLYCTLTVPLALPILLYQFINLFSSIYNDYTTASLLLSDKLTLMPILYSKMSANDISEGAKYASFIIASIPLVITTGISMRHFGSGEFASGMKL